MPLTLPLLLTPAYAARSLAVYLVVSIKPAGCKRLTTRLTERRIFHAIPPVGTLTMKVFGTKGRRIKGRKKKKGVFVFKLWKKIQKKQIQGRKWYTYGMLFMVPSSMVVKGHS